MRTIDPADPKLQSGTDSPLMKQPSLRECEKMRPDRAAEKRRAARGQSRARASQGQSLAPHRVTAVTDENASWSIDFMGQRRSFNGHKAHGGRRRYRTRQR